MGTPTDTSPVANVRNMLTRLASRMEAGYKGGFIDVQEARDAILDYQDMVYQIRKEVDLIGKETTSV